MTLPSFEWPDIGQMIWDALPYWIRDAITKIRDFFSYVWEGLVGFFRDPVAKIREALEWIWENLPDVISRPLRNLWVFLDIYWAGITSFFRDPIGAIRRALEWIWDNLPSAIREPLQAIQVFLGQVWQGIVSFFRDPVGRIRSALTWIWDNLPSIIKDPLAKLGTFLDQTWQGLTLFYRDPIGTIQRAIRVIWEIAPDWLKNMGSSLAKGMEDLRDRVVAAFDGAVTGVSQAIQGIPDMLRSVATGIGSLIAETWRGVLSSLQVGWDALRGFGEWAWHGLLGISEFMLNLGKNAVSFIQDLAKGIGEFFFNLLIKPIGDLLNTSTREVHKAVGLHSPQEIWTTAMTPLAPMLAAYIVTGVVAEAARGAGDTEIELFGCKVRPGFLKILKALDFRDVMESMLSGYMIGLTMAYFSGTIMEQLRRESLESGRPIPPDPVTCAWMLRKGLISEELYRKALARQGIMEDFEQPYLENIWLYPPYDDMIKIFVREAYEKKWPEMFELKLQDYPEDFGKWMEKIGYKEEWAKRLWAAHWVLPSTGQVYEMLWRKLTSPYTGTTFTVDDVARFLKEADIDPRWRENLVEIAYKLPGRIEGRWGLEWGVWDEEKFRRFLEADGIHPEWIDDVMKAEKANVFREHIGSVKSALVQKYRDGFLTEEELKNKLSQLGYPDEAITWIIWDAQERYDYELKKDLVSAYLKAFREDTISADELRSALTGLGMIPDRVEEIIEMETLKKQKAAPPPETLERRLDRLKEREASLIRQIEDKRTDLEDLKKVFEAEMEIYKERIEEQKMRIQAAKTPEAKAREEQKLKILEARMEKARVRYQARINDLEETIRMLEDRLEDVRTEIEALQQALGKPTAS